MRAHCPNKSIFLKIVVVHYFIGLVIFMMVFMNNEVSQEIEEHVLLPEKRDNMEKRKSRNPKYQAQQFNMPGENGTAVILPKNLTDEQNNIIKEGWERHMFIQYVSDMISVHRSLKDPRDDWCKVPGRFLEHLPATSIIVCFYNEAWSTLVRTVHSILDRTPKHLFVEIILVDDFSDMEHLMGPLDNYWLSEPKVKIIRTKKREGLIRARLIGAGYAKGEVLTFLDSHCECSIGWLEPLLDRIARNRKSVVCPFIDIIDEKSFEYQAFNSNSVQVGGFNWLLQFTWHKIPKIQQKRRNILSAPVKTPTMAGGLFSIDKNFFEWLGTYDSGFDLWGGENLELSFKTWMCGGTLEILPCSHVGHVFRNWAPYRWPDEDNVLRRNVVRLAEVWMDEYAEYFYQRTNFDKGNYGDITERKKLRRELGCKNFKWYVDNIYPDLFTPDQGVARGKIRNLGYGGDTCLGTDFELELPVPLQPCDQVEHQYFEWTYTKIGEIRFDGTCLDYNETVILSACHGGHLWKYNANTKQIMPYIIKECLSLTEEKILIVEPCNPELDRQKWILGNYSSN